MCIRDRSYRIATRLQPANDADAGHSQTVEREIDEFERRLDQLWRTGAISPAHHDPRHQTLQMIGSSWRDSLKPTLQNLAAGYSPATIYLDQVDAFVDKLDAFVKLLEQDTEAKMLLLRLVQGSALFMILSLIHI